MRSLKEKVGLGLWGTMWAGIIYSILGISGCFGSRGIKTAYEFKYKGVPAAVKFEDRRFWFDQYYIELDAQKIYLGSLKSDSGELVEVKNSQRGGHSSYNISRD